MLVFMTTHAPAATSALREHRHTFSCFGGECTVIVADSDRDQTAATAALEARARLESWHRRFSRFRADSELSLLNRAPQATVKVSPLLARIVQAGLDAHARTRGLVDISLGAEIAGAGYAAHLEPGGLALDDALALAPARRAARPRPAAGLAHVVVDLDAATITRPAGLVLDVGGIAKGVFADELARTLEPFDAFVVDCAGDLRIGGRARLPRPVHVAPPQDGDNRGRPLHTFAIADGAVATSGIGGRAWRRPDGRPAHHLLDPSTGVPAYTGLVQATALAPTAAEAEALAKAALLSGPERAPDWLSHGGGLVGEGGGYAAVPAVAGLRVEIQRSRSSSTCSRSGSFRISWNRPS